MRRSITVKLILSFLLVAVAGLALASGITYWLTVREFKQLVLNQSHNQFVADAALYYQINGSWDGVLNYFNLRQAAPHPGSPDIQGNGHQPGNGAGGGQAPFQSFNFILTDASGRVLVPGGSYQVGATVPAVQLSQGTAVNVNGVRVGTVLTVGSAPPLGALETQYLARTNQALLYAALGAALVALILGIFLARTLTHPLRDLTAAIQAVARGDLKQHVQVKSKDEIGELAAAFNQMSADLDHLTKSRRQMTADIAHDLRTPLTVIGGYIESMRDSVLKPTNVRFDTIHAEVQHLERLVEDLRTLSQADAGELSLNREPIAPAALLERMVRSYGPLAVQKMVTLDSAIEPGLPSVNVDPDRMAQVFGNLITNALRYTPKGGQIRLLAAPDLDGVALSVRDNGQGIPAESLPHIFDRFYRADPARSQSDQSGLGLAIARSIVEAHGGRIAAESKVGQGTTIKITLPARSSG
jgi:signal transduction histidine kinase